MSEGHMVLGFCNATDEQADAVNAIMKTGNFACVTFVRGEGVWLGWAAKQGDDEALLYFAIADGPPVLQAALDSLMIVLDQHVEGERISVTATVKRVES